MVKQRDIAVDVTPDVQEFFASAVVTGKGGFQSLCRLLIERLEGGQTTLHLSADQFSRVVRYAAVYGDGGFQSQLRKIVALWVNEHYSELLDGGLKHGD